MTDKEVRDDIYDLGLKVKSKLTEEGSFKISKALLALEGEFSIHYIHGMLDRLSINIPSYLAVDKLKQFNELSLKEVFISGLIAEDITPTT